MKWMQDLKIKKGAFKAKAAKDKGLEKSGKIKPSFTEKETHSKNPKTRKQATLAKTFAKARKK
jgi:hypothetical protein